MRRVSVVGNSGSGKTWLSGELSRLLGIRHVELDALYHQPGWRALDEETLRDRVAHAVSGEGWVVDGNYSIVRDLVWERADTVVWLDPPRHVLLPRLVARTLRRTLVREELWNGNREPLSNLYSVDPERSIIAWAWTRDELYRHRYRWAAADPRWSHLRFVRLRNDRQVRGFLGSLPGSG